MKRPARAAILAVLALALGSCQPPPRDIIVVWRGGHLAIDFPWSLWRLVGLQDRSYCISRVELFNAERLLWALDAGRVQCLDVRMPIRIGGPLEGFSTFGQADIQPSVTHGIAIDGIGSGRVDFVLRGRRAPRNVTDWEDQMEPPCGSSFGSCRTPARF